MLYCRSWCFSVYEKILHAQSVRAIDSAEDFRTWVVGYDGLSEVQKLRAAKKEAEFFSSSCLNLIAKNKTSGVLKTIQKDKAAETQQNRRDLEEFEGHVIPDPHKALPGNIFSVDL